jgi:hypothetical protein
VHVDLLVYDPIQVGGVNIKVFNLESLSGGYCGDGPDAGHACHGGKCLIEIEPLALCEPLGNQSSLEAIDCPGGGVLDLEYPLDSNGFPPWGDGLERVGLVGAERANFLLHSLGPLLGPRARDGLLVGGWFWYASRDVRGKGFCDESMEVSGAAAWLLVWLLAWLLA